MTTAQVVEMSVTVNNSPIQDYVHWDDQTQTKTSKKLSRLATCPIYSLMTGPKTRIQVQVAEFLLIRKA